MTLGSLPISVLLAVGWLCFGCGHSRGTTVEMRSAVPERVAEPLSSSDWRRALVGRWRVTFVVDSTSLAGSGAPRWSRPGAPIVVAELIVSDSVIREFPATGLRRSMLPDFAAALGRPLSCSAPDVGILGVRQTEDERTVLDFTPHARDCGLLASVRGTRDSLDGTWWEPSIGMPVSTGRVVMVRLDK